MVEVMMSVMLVSAKTHPSIQLRVVGAYSRCHWERQVASPSVQSDKQLSMLTLTSRDNLESLVHLTCMFFGRWEEEYPERSHTERPSWDLNQEPFCCEAIALTTTPLCSPQRFIRLLNLGRNCSFVMRVWLCFCCG